MREILIEKMYINDLEKHQKFLLSLPGIKKLTSYSHDQFKYKFYPNYNSPIFRFVKFFNLYQHGVHNSYYSYNKIYDLIRLVYDIQLRKSVLFVSFEAYSCNGDFLNKNFVAEIIFDCIDQTICKLRDASRDNIQYILSVESECVLKKLDLA